MPLRNDLLNPIPGAKPGGENLRYAPVYDKIKEARREDDEGPQGVWAHERKVADWGLVVKLASDTLATKTKDLQLAAWLTEAMLRRDGVNGLRESLELIRGLIEKFWDDLYPELEDGDAEMRAAPLQWVGDRLEIQIKNIPLTKSRLTWYKYKESRSVVPEDESKKSDAKRKEREAQIKEGKLPPEEFDKAFAETPKAFYLALEESFDNTLQTVSDLSDLCNEKFGDVAPSYGTMQRALEEVRQVTHVLLQVKREKEPDPVAEPEPPPPPEPVAQAAPPAAAQPVAAAAAAAAAAPAPAPVPPPKPAGLAIEPVDRPDAIARVVGAARFLRQKDEYSPAPYLLLRGLRWGELRAGGAQIDPKLLVAPPTEIRQTIKSLSLESKWKEVLENCELAMGQECGRGWLDLQRYVARGCQQLGSSYKPIRDAVVSSLHALLVDYPQLAEMTMMDDTPVANAETQAWFREEVVPPPPPPPEPAPVAAPEPEPVFTPPPAWQQAAPDAPPPPDTFDLAMAAARRGRPQEGIEMLMRELAQERSGRARFQRKVQVAQLCVSTGFEAVAHPILQELAGEIERRNLEEWEAADMVAHPLALLYGLAKDAPAEQRQKLYSWICRLDPLQALNVSR